MSRLGSPLASGLRSRPRAVLHGATCGATWGSRQPTPAGRPGSAGQVRGWSCFPAPAAPEGGEGRKKRPKRGLPRSAHLEPLPRSRGAAPVRGGAGHGRGGDLTAGACPSVPWPARCVHSPSLPRAAGGLSGASPGSVGTPDLDPRGRPRPSLCFSCPGLKRPRRLWAPLHRRCAHPRLPGLPVASTLGAVSRPPRSVPHHPTPRQAEPSVTVGARPLSLPDHLATCRGHCP